MKFKPPNIKWIQCNFYKFNEFYEPNHKAKSKDKTRNVTFMRILGGDRLLTHSIKNYYK